MNKLTHADNGESGYNLLLITPHLAGRKDIDKGNAEPEPVCRGKHAPHSTTTAAVEINPERAQFGLSITVSQVKTYYDGILNGRIPSALMTALSAQNYQSGSSHRKLCLSRSSAMPLLVITACCRRCVTDRINSGTTGASADVADRWSLCWQTDP